MKYCKQCKISTKSDRSTCPLCQAELNRITTDTYETFPHIEINYNQNYLVIRILLLISAVISIICLSINFLIPTNPFWGFYVVIGIICTWISLISALRRQKNVIRDIISQIVMISFFAVIWDVITGWHSWSIEYVLPIVCMNAIISIAVVAKILDYKLTDYLIYLILSILLGLVPIIFLALNIVQTIYPSLICIVESFIAFLVLITFEGKSIKEELRRRLHI